LGNFNLQPLTLMARPPPLSTEDYVSNRICGLLSSVDLRDQRGPTSQAGLIPGAEIANNGVTDLVAFYFGAGWCPPCQRFSPQLSLFADDNVGDFSVVLVSADHSAEEAARFSSNKSFLSVPWECPARQQLMQVGTRDITVGAVMRVDIDADADARLRVCLARRPAHRAPQEFNVRMFPSLIVCDTRGGGLKVITRWGVQAVQMEGSSGKGSAVKAWRQGHSCPLPVPRRVLLLAVPLLVLVLLWLSGLL
jgi:thiol-disulfide isomerase/thioredoxin